MIIYVSAASRQEAEFQGEAGSAEKAEVTSPEANKMEDSDANGKTKAKPAKRLQKMKAEDVDPTPAKKVSAKKEKKKRKGEDAAEQSSDLRKHFKAK